MKRFSRNIAIFLIALLLVLPFASCQSSADDEQAAEEVQIAGTIQETEPAQAEEVSPVPQEESVPEEVPVSITYEYMGYELTIEAYDGYALITYPQGATEEEVAAAEADLQAAVDQLKAETGENTGDNGSTGDAGNVGNGEQNGGSSSGGKDEDGSASGNNDVQNSTKAAKTGDTAPITRTVAVLLLAVVVIVLTKKRRTNSRA